ncbi:ABC transporter ATP-binding protein/permease [Alphaproteobacteria bacterium]|nr:ABC transporter ATP-binding protein/permease [Alphaproteobacteria bacterium]
MNFIKKIFSILNLIDKKNYFKIQLLFLLLIISLILESLSITLILPILAFFFSESSMNLGFLNYFLNLNDSLIYALVFFTFVITFKNLFNIFLGYFRTKFTFQTQIDISKKIFENILSTNYNFFISQSSASYIRNIFQEPNNFATGFINPLLIIVSEMFLVIGILIIISLVEPILFIYLILLSGVILLIFFKLIKNKIRVLGKSRQNAEFKRLREVNNAFDSYQVTKIFNLENFYISNYDEHSKKVLKAGVINETVANIPRFFLELLMIVLIILIIIYLKFFLKLGNDETLIILSLYGYAAFRIFPSINRIMVNIQNVQFSFSTFDLICKLVSENIPSNDNKKLITDFENSLEFKNIKFSYEQSKMIHSFNFYIKKNSITGILGPSGSGKTTLLNIISGLLQFQSGEVAIDGKNINLDENSLMGLYSYVPQSNLLIDGSVTDNIALGQSDTKINFKKINQIIDKLRLRELIKDLPQGLETNLGKNGSKISGGQAQRVCIARALYYDRKIIILDEPTSALDKKNENEFLNYLNDLKNIVTIIIVSHKDKSFKICDQIINIEN